MSEPIPFERWTVVGVVPVSGRGLLYCHAELPLSGQVAHRFNHVPIGGNNGFAKWVRKTQKKGPVLLCWDAPLTSAEFQRRGIERLARQWVRERFSESDSKPAIRSAGMRPHWISSQRLLGLPVHEGMAIRGALLQPKLHCENVPPLGSSRDLHVTEVHAPLAIGLHPAGKSLPWYRDNLDNAWGYYTQAARMWNLGDDDLPLPRPIQKFRMHDFIDPWVAMALGLLWMTGGGVELVGTRREGSFLLPTKI
ncbi:MAG: hypothetical protein ABI162_07165 [Luteolibacter sp.]